MAEQKVMSNEESQLVAFNIILHSGTARALVHDAINLMKVHDFEGAQAKMAEADEELVAAHQSQTDLLQSFAGGTKIEIEIIMVHAQDHLMTTMTLKEIAIELEPIYKALPPIEG